MQPPPSIATLTLAQLPVLVPYCWVRRLLVPSGAFWCLLMPFYAFLCLLMPSQVRDIHYLGYPMVVANVCLWGSLLAVIATGYTLDDPPLGLPMASRVTLEYLPKDLPMPPRAPTDGLLAGALSRRPHAP